MELLKQIIPENIKNYIKKSQAEKQKSYIASLPKLSQDDLKSILQNQLNIKTGDTVFIHSSTNALNLDFPQYFLIPLLQNIVGNEGTLVFPTYPKLSSYKFLKSREIFDIRKTPSYTGLLTEFARRSKGAVRSLHPTKSVVAIGKQAKEITSTHHKSAYPYSEQSPYYKLVELDAKVIGIGVQTTYLSCIHCVDDILADDFPVNPYYPEVFSAKCKNLDGEIVEVKTFAHKMSKMNFNIPKFMKKYLSPEVCKDIDIEGMKFFRASAKPLINNVMELAKRNICIYKRIHYKWNKII